MGHRSKHWPSYPEESSYSLTVPYETTGSELYPHSQLRWCNDRGPGRVGWAACFPPQFPAETPPRYFLKLDEPGKEKTFKISVTAEDGVTVKTYSLTFVREQPSSDARLKKLKVDNVSEFSPTFVSNKTRYDAIVSEGAEGVVITPTGQSSGSDHSHRSR